MSENVHATPTQKESESPKDKLPTVIALLLLYAL